MEETKKQKQKNSDQDFQLRVCVRIHRPTYAGQLYAYVYFEPTYAYFEPTYAYEACTCRHAQKNPNLESKNRN